MKTGACPSLHACWLQLSNELWHYKEAATSPLRNWWKSSLYLLLHWFFRSETQPLLPPPKSGQRRKGRPYLTPSISFLPTPHVNIMHPVLIIAVHINEWNNLLEQWASITSWPPGGFLLASQPVPFFRPTEELVNPRAHVWLFALPREEVGKAALHQRVFTTCWASAAVTNAARWAQSYASLSPSKPFTSASQCMGRKRGLYRAQG